jgi:protein-S-isoprenylcysteine O-methyltransferase Ste14
VGQFASLSERNVMAGPHWFYHPIMAAVWIATDAIWVIPEIVLSKRLPSDKDAQKENRGSKSLVMTALYLGIFLGFLAAIEVPSLSLHAHWQTVFAAGIAVWWGGILLRWYSIRVLGRFFTTDIAISRGQRVVEAGPYRLVRHPSYLGGLLALVGFGMTMTNWLAMFLPVCCLAAAYVYRIRVEEQALVRGLGPAYSEYMRRTWRLVPYVF